MPPADISAEAQGSLSCGRVSKYGTGCVGWVGSVWGHISAQENKNSIAE